MNKDEFTKKSIDKHGNTYSYDLIPEKVGSTDIDEQYSGKYKHRIWNAGHTKLKYWYQNRF